MMGRMADRPSLPLTIDIMLNFDSEYDGDGDIVGTCKQIFGGGGATYHFTNFSRKLYENKKCWPGPLRPLDPQLVKKMVMQRFTE